MGVAWDSVWESHEIPYGSRMGFRMGVAWDYTEQEEAARSCRTSATAQSERTNSKVKKVAHTSHSNRHSLAPHEWAYTRHAACIFIFLYITAYIIL
jgi:hypothetical protein